MSARKIIFLLSHAAAGGAQEIMANLADGFRDRGDDVSLMALYPGELRLRETQMPWRFVVPERPKSVMEMIGLGRAMIRLMQTERPDYVFTALPAANVLAAIGAFVARAPTRVVISHHSPASTHNRLIDALDSRAGALRSVKAVISVSDAVGASLDGKPASYRAKRRTIHNALPPRIEALLNTLTDQRKPATGAARRIIATGRLAEQKNYPTLIRAAARLPEATFEMIVVGSGPDEKALRTQIADAGLGERITLLGHMPREDALAVLASGDLFVQMSLFEGHSLALVEAAKLGLPLIVSDVPVQIEGVTAADGERCGVVVPVMDDAALALAIKRMLDDPAHRARYERLSRKLAAEATYEAMMASYDGLMR